MTTASKKSKADAIFASRVEDFKKGVFNSNKSFRAAVIAQIIADLQVSVASAATMYNAAKKAAETADPALKLGRDPKKEKPEGAGKRGRPLGSGKKVITVPAAEVVAETV